MTATQSPPTSTTPPPVNTTGALPRWHHYREVWLGILGLTIVLSLWQASTAIGLVDEAFSSSPLGALGALVDYFITGDIWAPLGSTMSTVAWGMAISLSVGIPLGLLIGRSKTVYGLTEPMISIMYSVPYVVFLPVIIFWFGIGDEARIVIVVWSALFPLLINVITGARNVDSNYLQVSKVFCASRLLMLKSVVFPATLPYILAGVRQAVGRGLVGAIVAELFMGDQGLGYLVQLQTANFNMDQAMAAIAVIAVVAVLLTRTISAIERQFTFWSASA